MKNEPNKPQNKAGPRHATIHEFKNNISRYLEDLRYGFTGGIILFRYKRPVAVILRPKSAADEAREEAARAAMAQERARMRHAEQRRIHDARMLGWGRNR